jgi:membrane protease YdiL (CAAX protease family)
LQTELTRRWGWVPGWLVANLVFTFGPLHADAYLRGGVHGGRLLAIFAIGLLFGLLYRRSGNLWIPAVLHGLWPLNMS